MSDHTPRPSDRSGQWLTTRIMESFGCDVR